MNEKQLIKKRKEFKIKPIRMWVAMECNHIASGWGFEKTKKDMIDKLGNSMSYWSRYYPKQILITNIPKK